MQDLITISGGVDVGGDLIQTVNARELHGFLQSAQDYSDWIKGRVKKYGFTENVDFTTTKGISHKTMENQKGSGRLPTEYHVSIDMAKELAMVERNVQGKQARQYFIECEKRLKTIHPQILPASFSEALRLLADTVEHNQRQTLQINRQAEVIVNQQPAVEFVGKYVEASGDKNFRTVAKLLGANELDFRAFLDSNKYMYKLNKEWVAYAVQSNLGHFTMRTGMDMNGRAFTQTLFTPKGIEYISRKWSERTLKLTRKVAARDYCDVL